MPVVLRYFPAVLICVLGFSTTLVATVWVERWERLSRQSEFQKQTSNLTTALQRTTNRYTELLLSISDYYDAADSQVDEAAFRRFVSRAVRTYPGIQALEWAPQIADADRAIYERQIGTLITEQDPQTGALIPAAIRDRYIPVTFVEPLQNNEAALGYDLASDPTRKAALELSQTTGAIAATGRIQLVQETAENQYGFLVFVPVYRQPIPNQAHRKDFLLGYIVGVFRVADVVEESLRNLDYDANFYVLDQTARPNEQLLGMYNAETRKVIVQNQPKIPARSTNRTLCASLADCTQYVQLGQRQWQIVFMPSANQSFLWGTFATLLIGLLLTATVLIYVSRWQNELRRTRELSDLKLRLFSMASHELRTPLSVITVSAQSMATNQGCLTPEQQISTVDRIQVAAKRMGQLVNDMLTLTRAEAGKLEFNPEIVDLEPFCQQLLHQVQRKNDQIISLAGNAVKTQIYADKNLLNSILINLLSNAAKYSPAHSPIQLVISIEAKAICFQVIDQGIGILPQDQSAIFEAFYRGKNVGSVSGIGLGLAVVKTCVDLHGGTLAIASQPGEGTCVSVVLPCVE